MQADSPTGDGPTAGRAVRTVGTWHSTPTIMDTPKAAPPSIQQSHKQGTMASSLSPSQWSAAFLVYLRASSLAFTARELTSASQGPHTATQGIEGAPNTQSGGIYGLSE